MMHAFPFDIASMTPFAGPAVGFLAVVAIVDVILKGWALWRAGRMSKLYWFIALLVINSAGILPVIFLLMTNEEYKKEKLVYKPS